MLLASSLSPRLDTQFEGYCFHGNDYIAELPGYAWHRQATGRTIGPGLDGCYVVAQWTNAGYEIGTDSKGLGKLFLYEAGADWAVCSSLHGLAQHLSGHGRALTPRRIAFDAMQLPGTFAQQLMSSSTMFEEISLVSSIDRLVLVDGALKRKPIDMSQGGASYEDALSGYVATWRSRALTLLADERTRFTVDISGGLDSRVGFAFMVASGRFAPDEPRFRLMSNERATRDYEIAQQVVSQFGHSLNGPLLERRRNESSADLAIERWQEHCLGVYLPVYFHTRQFEPLLLNAHGAGGEAFRYRHKSPSLRDRMRPYQAHLDRKEYRELVDLVCGDNRKIATRRKHLHPLTVQYREYRNRFHFGYAPHTRAMFTPLNSSSLDVVTDREGVDPVDIYHDIYDALLPGLKMMPFDNPTKQPSLREASPSALGARDVEVKPGRVYAVEEFAETGRAGGGAYRKWLEIAQDAVDTPGLDELIDPDTILRLRGLAATMRDGLPNRPAPNSSEMMGMSLAIAASFALKCS